MGDQILRTRWKSRVVIAIGFVVLTAIAAFSVVLYTAPYFLLRAVEVADLPDGAPISSQQVLTLAQAPVGQVNLMKVSLKEIERRILSEPWVKEVNLQKRLPGTLVISVTLREPRAIVQRVDGRLGYVDRDGFRFASLHLSTRRDLVVLSGVEKESQLAAAIKLLDVWDEAGEGGPLLGAVHFDAVGRGYRLTAAYPMGMGAVERTLIDLGTEVEFQSAEEISQQLLRVRHVLRYLADHRIRARQVLADAGKKIVVRIAHGS